MPNWCFNSAIITAKTEAELREFILFATQTHRAEYYKPFSDEITVEKHAQGVFWNFITPPEEIRSEYFGRQPQYPNSLPTSDPNWWAEAEARRLVSNHWYDWNITNWGTKWDIIFDEHGDNNITELKDGTWEMYWYFETAWSPAEPVFRAMAERFPNLTFSYEITEEANFFAGKLRFEDGVRVSGGYVDSPRHNDFVALDVPCVACNDDEVEECYLTGGK
jgi:hypothetical protein